MRFQDLLHSLIGLTGRKVIVSAVTADAYPLLTVMGTITHGLELGGEEPDSPDEVIYMSINGTTDAGFMLARSALTGARWHGPVLRITFGQTVIEIEPT